MGFDVREKWDLKSIIYKLFWWILLMCECQQLTNIHRSDKQECNNFSYPSVKTCVLGAQKNHIQETALLSIHNICFA